MITHQLEVCNPNCTFVIHLLLVFILNQTLHQITCVDLVISYILHTQITMQTSKMFHSRYIQGQQRTTPPQCRCSVE